MIIKAREIPTLERSGNFVTESNKAKIMKRLGRYFRPRQINESQSFIVMESRSLVKPGFLSTMRGLCKSEPLDVRQ